MTEETQEEGGDELPVWAQNIQRLAEATGLTHAELARRAGMTRDAFHRYATGKTRPPTDRTYQLADLFGVNPKEIDPTRVYLRKERKGATGSAMQPYTLSAPLNGDPDLMHLKLEMDFRHMNLARILELVADERKWQLTRDRDDGET